MKTARLIMILAYAFIIAILVIIYSLATKSILLQIYIISSIITGITLTTLIYLSHERCSRRITHMSIAILAFVLWNFHNIATDWNLVAFYDAYNELMHLKLILNNERVLMYREKIILTISRGEIVKVPVSELGYTPGYSPIYPLFSTLSACFSLITGLNSVKIGTLLPSANGVLLFLSTFLIVNKLIIDARTSCLVILLAMLAFTISPDMIYSSTHFYHRELSLGLCFLLFYLLLKHLIEGMSLKGMAILTLLILILPLSHSYYPNVYMVMMLTLSIILCIFSKVNGRIKVNRWVKPIAFPTVVLFMDSLLWNFITNISSPIPIVLSSYINSLLNPKFEVGELNRFKSSAAHFLPDAVRPVPWTVLLIIRDLLLYIPIVFISVTFVYNFLMDRIHNKIKLLALFIMLSFTPIIVLDYTKGGTPLTFRYYAFPLIAYSFGLFYSSIVQYRIKFIRILPLIFITFLIAIALLSPFSHIYYPRQLYDPSVKWRDIGFPHPRYIYFSKLVKYLYNYYIISDYNELLVATLPANKFNCLRKILQYYGMPNTYIVEFIRFNSPLGYTSSERIRKMQAIKLYVNFYYNRVLDHIGFSIYCNDS